MRGPFQGVSNIVRFNWHFYLTVGILVLALSLSSYWLPREYIHYTSSLAFAIGIITLTSLLISFLIYDHSDLYKLPWLDRKRELGTTVTVNAGFDETTSIIRKEFPRAVVTVLDFYDPAKHTEMSIKRARVAYPPEEGSISITTEHIPFGDGHFDTALAILSAHEIRDDSERVRFFLELNRVLQPDGRAFVTEHLRDLPNFLAYTVGFFHFFSTQAWKDTFHNAGFQVVGKVKTTWYITTFELQKDGAAS